MISVVRTRERGERDDVTTATTSAAPAPAKVGRPRLTGPQAAAARQLVGFVAGLDVGAEARLLALIIAVRAAREGQANLTSLDVRCYDDPQAALAELAAGGWIAGDFSRVVEADPTEATRIQAGGLTGLVDPPMGKTVRTRVSGWISRTLAAKPLKKTTVSARLAALGLVLYADPATATGTLPDLPDRILTELTPGWITLQTAAGYQLSDIAAGCLPTP
jgi:hypothetical protein